MSFVKLHSGDTEIVKHIDNKDDYVFVSENIKSEGFHIQQENYRFRQVYDRGSAGAKIWVDAECNGEYYIGLQVYDSFGSWDEEFHPLGKDDAGPFCERIVEMSIDGEAVGTFRYGGDDRKYYTFFTGQKQRVKKGSRICYTVIDGNCAYFTAVILTPRRPEIPANKITNITAENGQLRFITAVASKTEISFGTESFVDMQYVNNHRFGIPERLYGIRFQITATDEEGNITRARYVCTTKDEIRCQDKKICIPLENSTESRGTLPIRSVLPFSKGDLFSINNIGIRDENGNIFTADAKATSKWQDGSIRTAAVCSVLPIDGRKFYAENMLNDTEKNNFYAENIGNGIRVVNGDREYLFDNGTDSVIPDKKLRAVLYDKDMHMHQAIYDDFEICEYGRTKIEIVRNGYFKVKGKNTISSSVHISFYRGFDAFELEYAFGNEYMEAEHYEICGLYLESDELFGENTNVYQYYDNKAEIDKNIQNIRHNGCFKVCNTKMNFKDFWQNYPKSVVIDEMSVKIGICPFITKPELYNIDDIMIESKLFFYMRTGKYKFHSGLRKFHTLYFGQDAQSIENIPFLIPEKSLLEKTRGFGNITASCVNTSKYDKYMSDSYDKYIQHREKNQEYGMLNYGDSHGERKVHWTNMEYDFPYGTLIHFLRTGDERFYRLAETAAAHLEEIDCSHRNRFFEENGYFWIHTVGHANNYYTPEEFPNCFTLIKSHIGHIFAHGLMEYYKVTGCERYKQAVIACADTVARYYTTKYDFLTEREPGWSMLLLETAYELTLDEYYLNACRLILKRVYQKQDEKTGCLKYYMLLTPDENIKQGEVIYGGKSFMHGILGTAMKYFYYLTGDERAKKAALDIARWLAEDMYDENMRCFWYTEALKQINQRDQLPETNIEIIDVITFAYLETGNPYYLHVVENAFEEMLESTYRNDYDIAKVFTMRMRFAPEIMHDILSAKKDIKL